MWSNDRWIRFEFEVWSWRWLDSPFSPGPETSSSWRWSWIIHTIHSQKWDEMNYYFLPYIWQHTVTSARNTAQEFDPHSRGLALRLPCHPMRGSAEHCLCWRACHRWLDPAVCSGPSCATCALEAPLIRFRARSDAFSRLDEPGDETMTILLEIFLSTQPKTETADIKRWKNKDEINRDMQYKKCAATHHASCPPKKGNVRNVSNIEKRDWTEDNLTKKAGGLPSIQMFSFWSHTCSKSRAPLT